MVKSKKELWFWRFLVIILLFLLWKPNKNFEINKDCLVRGELYGMLTYNSKLLEQIEYLRNNPRVRGLILRVNSPGGTIVGGESLYRALKAFAKEKPLYSLVEDAATSGAYMAILPSHKIYSYETSTLGSIGVLTENFDFTGLMEKLGVSYSAIKSSNLKNPMNPFEKTSPEALKAMEHYVEDCQVIFKKLVQESRSQIKNLDLVTNGDIFTGGKALQEGLIDALGSEEDLIKVMQLEENLSLPIIDYSLSDASQDSFDNYNPLKRLLDLIL